MNDPRQSHDASRSATVKRLAEGEGFALLGIAPATPLPDDQTAHLRQWLATGKHGDMDYLAAGVEEMLDPRKLVPGAKAIICVAMLYSREAALTSENLADPHGRIARFAWHDDYHRAIKKRLHNLADALRERWPEHTFRSCVDTAPVLERHHAQNAGLGWIGKHTLLIHPRLGSWFLLGEIITTLPVATADPAAESPVKMGHCGTCTRCIDACPTHCIASDGYSIDASRCISYLTIEHRGRIDPALQPAMGNWIAGCDVCQEVCPFNHDDADNPPRSDSATPLLSQPTRPRSLPLAEMLDWEETDRGQAVHKSSLKRIKLQQFKRNALIALGNHLRRHDAPTLRQRVKAIAEDENESELVRQTAREVLASLRATRH